MLNHVKKVFIPVLIVIISLMLGYVLRVYHEGKIRKHYQSQAEKEMATLEEEFHSAWEKPRTFYIFNGRFEVYPLKESERTFYYRQLKDTDFNGQGAKASKGVGDKNQDLESPNDARLLGNHRQ
jgi:hypothetical protein